MKIVLLGNAGAGKSTMAKALIGDSAVRRLSLDEIAWEQGATRKPLSESVKYLEDFIRTNQNWIMEGCYGDLVEVALPHCDELRFLNPGVEICVAHCHARPWEPEKFDSPEHQEQILKALIAWVKNYESRDDEYGLRRHRQIFDNFKGKKREYKSVDEYQQG